MFTKLPTLLYLTLRRHGFDHRHHSGVLLDGVGDAKFLKAHRETLQGRAKVCKAGQSATNVYAYGFCLARRGIVATFDLGAKNLQAFDNDHWLQDRRNVIVLRLQDKAYIENAPAQPRESNSHPLPAITTASSSTTPPLSAGASSSVSLPPIASPARQPPLKRRMGVNF